MTPFLSAKPNNPNAAKDRRGWWIPWMIFGIFVVMTALFAWFIWIAVSTDTGVVSINAYQQGLEYNAIIAQQSQSDQLPWELQTARGIVNGNRANLELRLSNPQNRDMSWDAVRAWLVRPAHAGMDMELPLRDMGGGRYAADFDLPEMGMWELRVTAAAGQKQKQWQQDIQWR